MYKKLLLSLLSALLFAPFVNAIDYPGYFVDVYLRGAAWDSWGIAESRKFTYYNVYEGGDNKAIYQLACIGPTAIPNSKGFKIASEDWGVSLGSGYGYIGSPVVFNKTHQMYNNGESGNLTTNADFTGIITIWKTDGDWVNFEKMDNVVYFDNVDGWDEPYIYIWGNNITGTKAWPGIPMIKMSDGRWAAPYPDGATGIKISDKGDEGKQTSDIVPQNGATYTPADGYLFGIRGEIFDGKDWSNQDLSRQPDGTWTYEGTIKGGNFGIREHDEDHRIEDESTGAVHWLFARSAAEAAFSASVTQRAVVRSSAVSNGTNFKYTATDTSNGDEVIITFDPKAMTLTIVQKEKPVDPAPEGGYYIYVNTKEVGWTEAPSIHVWNGTASDADLIVEQIDTYLWKYSSSKTFPMMKITKKGAGNQNADNTGDITVEYGALYTIRPSVNNQLCTTDVTPGYEPGPSEPEFTGPTRLYISTNLSGNSSSASAWKHGAEMARNGKKFSAVVVAANNTKTGNYVYFFTNRHTEWPVMLADGFGAGDADLSLTADDVASATPKDMEAGAAGRWKLPETGTYTVTADFTDTDRPAVTFRKHAEAANGYVYFNIGQDYYVNDYNWPDGKGGQKTPYAIFYNGNDEPLEAAVEMERIEADMPLFRAAIPDGALGHRVSFASTPEFTSVNDAEHTVNVADGEHIYHSYRSPGYADDDWTHFIYVTDKGGISQSYCTIDDFSRLRANRNARGIVIIGNGSDDFNWNIKNENLFTTEKSDEGVYIDPLTFGYSQFKMSLFNPVKDFEANGASATSEDKRLWANFDLGLIGPALEYYDANGKAEEFDNDHAEVNPNIYVDVNSTVSFNVYNQYNWCLKDGASTEGRYLVVDVDYGTVCLIDFNPAPGITLTLEENKIVDLNETGGNIADLAVPGSDDSGANLAHYRFVNVREASAKLTPAPRTAEFASKYTIDYELTFNKESLGRYADKTAEVAEIALKSIIIDSINSVTARGYFSDDYRFDAAGNNLVFRSRTARPSAALKVDHAVPEAPALAYFTLYNDDAEDGYYDALVGLYYTLPNRFVTEDNVEEKKTQSVYPSYNVYIEDALGNVYPARVATETEAIALRTGFTRDYTFPTSEEEFTGEHSWAYQSILAVNDDDDADCKGYLPLYVPSVLRASDFEDKTFELKVVAGTVAYYPYQVYADNIDSDALKAPASGMRREAPATESRIINVDKASELITREYNGDNWMVSSVGDAIIDAAASGSTILFNLSGVRVETADPAPGIYIRRNADCSVSKIAIR